MEDNNRTDKYNRQDTHTSPGDNQENESAKKKQRFKSLGFILVALAIIGKLLKPLLVFLKFSKFGATIVSMLVTLIAYSFIFGWKFALGFVILLLIHENGHMLAARKIGLPVSKPIFIPFMGAFIAMKEMPQNARQEAIIGMGGPLFGGLASLACFFLYDTFNEPYWLAMGYTGCFLNLFNLVPLGFLDGGRIATAISLWLWVPGAVVLGLLGYKTGSPLIFLVLILGLYEGYKVFKNRRKPETLQYYQIDPSFRLKMGVAYLLLVAALGAGMGISLEILESMQTSFPR